MVEVKGEFSKHSTSTSAGSTAPGRWNYVDAVNGEKICQWIRLKSTLEPVHI